MRWRTEDWHRTLKTGCDVEKIAHTTADERVKRAVTLNAVIAWRLATLTLQGRDTPELPAQTMFTDTDIAMLPDFAHVNGFAVPGQEDGLPDHENISLDHAPLLVMSGSATISTGRMTRRRAIKFCGRAIRAWWWARRPCAYKG